MKKLMIATAALCAAVGASALESANTVGYQQFGITPGDQSMTGAMFCGTGQSTVDLTTIVPSCEYEYDDLGESYFTIMYYNPSDSKTYKYDWNIVGKDVEDNDVWGWVYRKTSETVEVGDRVFAAGQGFWIMSGDDPQEPVLTISGEVLDVSKSQQYVSVALVPGDQLAVLCPVPQSGTFDLTSIIPECEYEYDDLGESYFTIMYYYPGDGKTYKYDWNIVGKDVEDNDVWGWVYRKTNEIVQVGDRVFSAGEGFWAMCGDDPQEPVIKFLNPIYSAE